MGMGLLADLDLQELLRLGFVALVVVGSMVGGIIKNLRDKKANQAEDTPTPGDGGPSTSPPERARPARPVAQPMPPRPQTPSAAPQPPPAQAWQSRPASAPPRPAGSSPRGHPQQAPSAPSLRPRPARAPLIQRDRQAPPRRPAEPTARPVTHRLRPPVELQAEAAGISPKRPSKPVARRKAKPPTARKLDKPKRRTLEQEMRARDVAAEPAIVTGEIGDEIDPIRHPTRASLRQAILLNEILSPPLALRPPEEAV